MSKLLLVLPHDRFRDEEYTEIREGLEASGHQVSVGSTHLSSAHGHFGTLVKPDVVVTSVSTSDYDGILFIGGRGVDELVMNSTVLTLSRDFASERKIVGAVGMAVEILANAGVVAGKKVTCDTAGIDAIEGSGGYYTGRLVEEDANLITGMGVRSSTEFAKTVAKRLK